MTPRFHPPRRRTGALALAVALSATAGLACTTVALRDGAVVAYSYDQSESGVGLVTVNARDAQRRSIGRAPQADWQARHGSVTFNQFGPGMPTAGMNEAGLAVTLMWNDAVGYGAPDGRPQVNELEFIQVLLDRAADVPEALALAETVRIDGMIPIHYFLADASGAAAVLRPDGGRLEVVAGGALTVPALTNTDYAALIAGLTRFAPFGGTQALPGADVIDEGNSLARFGHAALAVEAGTGDAFAALETVRNRATQWQIAFEPAAGRLSWRSSADGPVAALALAEVDFACALPPVAMPVAAAGGLAPLTPALHLAVLEEAFAAFPPLQALGPGVAAETVAAQAAAVTCPP